jgi:anaerobic ribonucleoside-triphosphate reductase activating protein
MPETLLNVATVRPRTRTNGPGWRAAVWVQGCTIRCLGCFNPHTHAHEAKRLWCPEDLAERLVTPDVEGITILGGEPFEQAAAGGRLATRARELGASVVTYSGYTWSYLRRSTCPEVQALIAASDVLIAGPYVAAKRNDGVGWHGSTNQEVVFLTERYDQTIFDDLTAVPVVEAWSDGAQLVWSGIPGVPDEPAVETVDRRRETEPRP